MIPFSVGGGVRTAADVLALLQAGADKVSINTAAVEEPDLVTQVADRLGSANLIVAIDARRREFENPGAGWEVYTHGGRRPTGIDALEWALRVERAGRGRSCSRAWTTTGLSRATTCR